MARMEIKSETAGLVWKIIANAGQNIAAGAEIIILESMKMEIPIESPAAGKLTELLVKEEDMVEENQTIAILETAD